MPTKYFLIIRNYVLSVSSQSKYNFYHQNALLDAFRTNSRNIIGRKPSMVIPLLANQDLTPMLPQMHGYTDCSQDAEVPFSPTGSAPMHYLCSGTTQANSEELIADHKTNWRAVVCPSLAQGVMTKPFHQDAEFVQKR